MKRLFLPAIALFILLTFVTGVVYPVLITIFAQVLFPAAANGSLILRNGQVIGSALIGQNFTDPKYFWGRPSATADNPYNGAASAGSNLGPSNPTLVAAVKSRIEALQNADPTNRLPVPIDLITTSASGLDPHISPAAAAYQVERIARIRHIEPQVIRHLIINNTQGREFGLFGQARVNVLAINLALDALYH